MFDKLLKKLTSLFCMFLLISSGRKAEAVENDGIIVYKGTYKQIDTTFDTECIDPTSSGKAIFNNTVASLVPYETYRNPYTPIYGTRQCTFFAKNIYIPERDQNAPINNPQKYNCGLLITQIQETGFMLNSMNYPCC